MNGTNTLNAETQRTQRTQPAPPKNVRPAISAILCASALMLLALLPAGCARLSTLQTDESPERTITTKVSATAFFSSAQVIEKLKASTTDKSQSVGTDLNQHGDTNFAGTLDALTRLLQTLRPAP